MNLVIEETGELMTENRSEFHFCSFESRRSEEMRSLIERHNVRATIAPSMRELPLDDHAAVFEFADELFSGRIDICVFMTGVGTRVLLDCLLQKFDREHIVTAFNSILTVVRGPKPASVLREWGIHIDSRAKEPNTWREVLELFDPKCPVAGKAVAIQEYGQTNTEFSSELKKRGAQVMLVPIYRWGLPEEIEPLKAAIEQTIAGNFNALLFTSAQQVRNVLQVADSLGLRQPWLEAAQKCTIGSIGPTNSEALREAGLHIDVEASPPKMGQLVKATLESVRSGRS